MGAIYKRNLKYIIKIIINTNNVSLIIKKKNSTYIHYVEILINYC